MLIARLLVTILANQRRRVANKGLSEQRGPNFPKDRGSRASASGQWQVSTAGGIYPRWRPDGKELYYIGPDGQMMAAAVTVTGMTFEPGTPVALFDARIFEIGRASCRERVYVLV